MTGKGDNTGGRETWVERAAALIRERSAAAELISGAELSDLITAENLAVTDATKAGNAGETGDNGEAGAALLVRLLEANDDLREISEADSCSKNSGAGPRYYYSSLYLTEAYARILVHKLAGPLQLIAASVRDYTGAYRRPLAVDIFAEPPFLFNEEGMRTYLDLMAQTAGFEDIAATSAAKGGNYLYSKRFLDDGHAAMLAEWLDAGQAANP